MARKKTEGATTTTAATAEDKGQGRIELKAPVDWIARLDETASKMGMSRGAYIRMACNMRLVADRATLGLKD